MRPSPTNADTRHARLSASLSGTNLSRASDYNQRIVLQAIWLAGETTRPALVEQTGLTMPAIAAITRRLVESGFVREVGKQRVGRGQPATVLAIDADGGFSFGLNIDRDHISLVLTDLVGKVRARKTDVSAFLLPEDVRDYVGRHAKSMVRQIGGDPSRILGIGIALPDDLDDRSLPNRPLDYELWRTVDLQSLVPEHLAKTVHVDNDAAAAAMGEARFGAGRKYNSFFYMLISAGVGGGVVADGIYYRGASARSGEIGYLPIEPGSAQILSDVVSLTALQRRLSDRGMHDIGDPAARKVLDQWIADAARALKNPFFAVNCLLNPQAILIGGRLPGDVLARIAKQVNDELLSLRGRTPYIAPVLSAEITVDAAAIGAAMLPLFDRILPSQQVLMKLS